jgi:hypothetical protein
MYAVLQMKTASKARIPTDFEEYLEEMFVWVLVDTPIHRAYLFAKHRSLMLVPFDQS